MQGELHPWSSFHDWGAGAASAIAKSDAKIVTVAAKKFIVLSLRCVVLE